jgi:hypothetical protein
LPDDDAQEANVLDNRNAEVWAYLALTLLARGEDRLHEAEHAREHALRCGLNNTGVLRELAR